jgi:Tol biopolymer transport system component
MPTGGVGGGAIRAVGGDTLGTTIWPCGGDQHCWELQSAAWSPDGTKLTFSVTSYGAPDDGYNGLHVVDITTLKDVKVLGGEAADPAWSPDGATLAIVSRGIYLVGADGSYRPLYPTTGAGDYAPTWSPDSSRLAFGRRTYRRRSSASTLGSSIWTIRRNATKPTLLVRNAGWPAWSPDGTRIAYRSTCGIELMTPAGKNVTPRSARVTLSTPNPRECNALGLAGVPSWSPDGRKLAIARGTSVYVMNADGSNLRRVAEGLDPLVDRRPVRPAWQPTLGAARG